MGTDGPSIDAEAERQEGEEEDLKIGGETETGENIVLCVWPTRELGEVKK